MGCTNGKLTSDARLDGKTIIVTGANTGIGMETCDELYARGGRVLMCCRDMIKAELSKKELISRHLGQKDLGQLEVMRLDLASLVSVRQCAKEILDKENRIDILINNAGIMMCKKESSLDGYELQLATNHLGHFLFTMLLLPRMLRVAAFKSPDDPSRIINLSSVAHSFVSDMYFEDINMDENYTPSKAYFRSKAANVFFTKSLAKRLQGKNIQTYAVHPGIVDTPLWRHSGNVFPGGKWFMSNIATFAIKTPKDGAQTTLHCALDQEAAKQTGLYYADCKVKHPTSFVQNEEIGEQLFDLSIQMVHLDLARFDPFKPEVQMMKEKEPDIPTIDL